MPSGRASARSPFPLQICKAAAQNRRETGGTEAAALAKSMQLPMNAVGAANLLEGFAYVRHSRLHRPA
jgi:hypothetical protein